MNFPEWHDATNPQAKGVDLKERLRRHELRKRVVDKADTTMAALRVAKCRGTIGDDLLGRLIEATAEEDEKILLSDEKIRREAARPSC